MTNQNSLILLNLIESVLGKSSPKARNNYAFMCPNGCHHSKPKLEINLTTQQWACWICNDFKGKKLVNLFKKLKVSPEKLIELNSYLGEKTDLGDIQIQEKVELPKEFKTLLEGKGLFYKQALSYARSRGITKNDILKYNIGYCEEGPYQNMIIIPSYDKNGILNYFFGRSFQKDSSFKKNPQVSRNIIPFELFINWNVPVILCEGMLDAIAIKRNVIPLLGKNIQSELMKKLLQSNIQKIYISLDMDKWGSQASLKHCETLINEGKEVYLVDLNDKDPSEMGFEKFTNLIQTTFPLTFSNLIEKKLQMV